jgi:translation initiation factor IF-3
MRGAANFNPEWGYLAPAPSFMRTVRIVVVAAAVGASAGAAVVFSLVDRPAAEESVAARTLAVEPAAAPLAAPAVVQLPAQDERQPQSAAEAGSASTVQRPAGIAALAESPPATDAAPARVPTAPNGTTLQNTPIKPQLGWRSPAPPSARAVRGPLALLPSPGARAATGTNPPRVVN